MVDDLPSSTSQLSIEHWYDYISEATLANAILDRLLHGSHRLNLRINP